MKNVGLGKNTPIQLRLSKENYEALVIRHGQYIRWLIADKCACTLRSGRPDYNCIICGGDGIKYSFQRIKTIEAERAQYIGDGVVELDCPSGSCLSVSRITDGNIVYEAGDILDGKLVRIIGEQPNTWSVLEVTYQMTDEISGSYNAVYQGDGVFLVDIPSVLKSGGEVAADIIEVVSLINLTTDIEYTVNDFKRNIIHVEGDVTIAEGDVIVANVKYLAPRVFLLLGQAANKVEQQFLDMIGGDASMTFPNEYTVSEGDVVTGLVATIFQKSIITRSGTDFDKVPEWYIADIIKIENADKVYIKGVDYILFDRNKIKWIGDSPDEGREYSIMFSYHPTYKVLRDFPNTRSSENQMLPRRVGLKLMTMGGNVNEGL